MINMINNKRLLFLKAISANCVALTVANDEPKTCKGNRIKVETYSKSVCDPAVKYDAIA